MTLRNTLAALAAVSIAALAPACGKGEGDGPRVPASSDPAGKDLVEGAVVAASEPSGGFRLNKIVHVDDYPNPVGYQLHLIAYEPKGATFEEAAQLWRKRDLKIVINHFEVRQIDFMKRNYRVLAVEKVTDAERAPYIQARDGRNH